MPHQIQADVDQLHSTVEAMRAFSEVLHNHHKSVIEKAGALVNDLFTGNFQALMRDAITTFDPRVWQLGGSADDLARRLAALAQRLVEADIFPGMPPQNMAALYQEVHKLYEGDTPIKIVQTADGEYLIMLAGTEPNPLSELGKEWTTSNNPLSALKAGQGDRNNEYYRDILQAIAAANIPSGSTVRLAGHSLGGMEAMLLAQDPAFNARYNVADVITFGSPDRTLFRLGGDGDTHYHQYAANGDPIPYLTPMSAVSLFTGDPWRQEMIEKGDHGSYGGSAILAKKELDFKIDPAMWQQTGQLYGAETNDLDAKAADYGQRTIKSTLDTMNQAADQVVDTANATRDMAVDGARATVDATKSAVNKVKDVLF